MPGQLNQTFSAGCNKLIRENKAQIYTSPKDLIETLNWNAPVDQIARKNQAPPLPVDITEEESQVLALLRQAADRHIDDLSWQSQIPMGRLASLLLSLEFRGFVRSLPGKNVRGTVRVGMSSFSATPDSRRCFISVSRYIIFRHGKLVG